MGLASHHGQFAEVFVECDQNAILPIRKGQDLVITGIDRPVSCPDDIMACGFQWSDSTTPDAGIEQQLHEADSRGKGSMRS